jgi:hypothetical protein
MYPRWCQPQIELDSLPSVEYFQELSQLVKKSEFWDPTMTQQRRKMTVMKKVFKELF